jgi:hypothetical protein
MLPVLLVEMLRPFAGTPCARVATTFDFAFFDRKTRVANVNMLPLAFTSQLIVRSVLINAKNRLCTPAAYLRPILAMRNSAGCRQALPQFDAEIACRGEVERS